MQKMAESSSARRERIIARLKQTTGIHNTYWCKVWKSHGFDVEGFKGQIPYNRMQVYMCKPNKPNDYPPLVALYAKMGLHRYNMLQGTDWQLHHIQKYNVPGTPFNIRCRPLDYYITLVAKNPATGSLNLFRPVFAKENGTRWMSSVVLPDLNIEDTFNHDLITCQFGRFSVPKWPEDDALADGSRFYLVPESEWQENDWIRLYTELAFATTNREIDNNPKLSDLNIVKVVVETSEKVQPNELKGATDVIVYVKYDQDLGDGGICKRRAIVIRSLDLKTGRLSLMGGDYLDQPADSEHE